MNAVGIADFVPLTLDLMVAAIAVLVLLADLFSKDDQPKRWLGYLTAVLLAMVLGASFSTNTEGWAFFETYAGGAWPLFFKQVFLVTGLLATLGSIDHVARHQPHRQGEYYVLLCFSLLGMMLLPGARDLLLLVVCFELMGIPLFVLAAYAKQSEPGAHAPEAALKLYVVGVASTAAMEVGTPPSIVGRRRSRIAEARRVCPITSSRIPVTRTMSPSTLPGPTYSTR